MYENIRKLAERRPSPIMYSDRNAIDVVKEFPDLFHTNDPSPEGIKKLEKFLRVNRDHNIILYHGTSKQHDIGSQGLLPTTTKRRNSYQSGSGYVYLSVFPEMARTFGEIAYPRDEVVVYKCVVPIEDLKVDKDQLGNKRLYSGSDVKDTLANSLVIGHGATIRGKIDPYMIREVD